MPVRAADDTHILTPPCLEEVGPLGEVECESKSACDRYGICTARYHTEIIGWSAAATAILAGMFSENSKLLFFFQFVTFVLSTAAWSIWYGWQVDAKITSMDVVNLTYVSEYDSFASEPSFGTAAKLFVCGSALALISSVIAAVGSLTCEGPEGKVMCIKADGPMNDGITTIGRIASLLIEVVWILLLFSALNPDWSTTDSLGTSGGFCLPDAQMSAADQQLCDSRKASFGLWGYCMEERFAFLSPLGNELHTVCLKWEDAVQVTGHHNGTGTRTGFERFDLEQGHQMREAAVGCLITATLLAMLGDVISEKLGFCIWLTFFSAILNICGYSVWVAYEKAIDTDGTLHVDWGAGLAIT